MNLLELINDVLWKILKKSLWFRAEKSARDYYETNAPTFCCVCRYAKKGYPIRFWIA